MLASCTKMLSGLQALLEAARCGDVDAINAALAAGADAAAWVPGKGTALQQAAKEGHVHAIFALVLAGADPNPRGLGYGLGCLTLAAMSGHLKAVQALLAAGAVPDADAMEAAVARGQNLGPRCKALYGAHWLDFPFIGQS